MRNVWFDRNEYGFDVSQGGWILENVTQENSTNASAAQYAKLVQIRNRFAQGAGLDKNASGYDPSQDAVENGGSGGLPSWVNSGYENGTMEMTTNGFKSDGSMSWGYHSSEFKISNMAAANPWIDIGSFTLTGTVGETVVLEFVGTGHFDSSTNDPRPGGTNYGGGVATILMQQKDSATKSRASWYATGASPIVAVRVDTAQNRPHVYVQLAQYTGPVAMTVKTSSKSNFEGGVHYYHHMVLEEVDASVAEAFPLAPANWNASNGNYGIGFDMDTGLMSIDGPALSFTQASPHLPILYNGEKLWVNTQPSLHSMRVQHYDSPASLPKATDNPYGIAIVEAAVSGNSVTQWRLAFCTGEAWFTADGSTNLGTGVTYDPV